MEKQRGKRKPGQRFYRNEAIKKLITYYGGVNGFCERLRINGSTLRDWLRDGIPHPFVADWITIAASNPQMFDVLLEQARGEDGQMGMGIAV